METAEYILKLRETILYKCLASGYIAEAVEDAKCACNVPRDIAFDVM
jgi:hypothetical protein